MGKVWTIQILHYYDTVYIEIIAHTYNEKTMQLLVRATYRATKAWYIKMYEDFWAWNWEYNQKMPCIVFKGI